VAGPALLVSLSTGPSGKFQISRWATPPLPTVQVLKASGVF